MALIDKEIEVDDWIAALERLGIDTRSLLEGPLELAARSNTLAEYARRFESDGRNTEHELARHLALHDVPYQEAISQALAASVAATDGIAGTVVGTFTKAAYFAGNAYVKAFRAHISGLRPELERVLGETVEGILRNRVDAGLITAEAAARSGETRKWLELERLHATYREIDRLLRSWRSTKTADLHLVMRDEAAVSSLPRLHKADHVWLALAVTAGGDPAILTEAELASLERTHDRSPKPIGHAAMQDAANAQQAHAEAKRAEAAFTHPRPKAIRLPRGRR